MCGFAGFISNQSKILDHLESNVTRMASTISSRGPDDFGAWGEKYFGGPNQSPFTFTSAVGLDTTSHFGVALGFRRLAVIELTNAGHQPMTSPSGRYVITFNGEIYNHLSLRALLSDKVTWKGHSDTETLLACIEYFGLKETLQKTIGMFAIALWDKELKTLYLTRDRFGEKPLYYGWAGGENEGSSSFIFGSELKALRAFPNFKNVVCRAALAQYVRFSYVPTPYSIFESVFKLEPGCLLKIKANDMAYLTPPTESLRPGSEYGGLSMYRWWSLAGVVKDGANDPITSEAEALKKLEDQLIDSVKLQSLADVPVGAFLSGGVDSSTIVALMQAQNERSVKTFTIGFEESAFDESPHAKAVAKHLKTDHTEIFVTSKDTQSIIPELPSIYDEPFADSSQIPTHLVCKLAKKQVTVALSGDAGDELFGGYRRYFWAPQIWSRLDWIPYKARSVLGKSIKGVPNAAWDFFGRTLSSAFYSSKGVVRLGEKAHKLANRLHGVRNMDDLYFSLISEWQDPSLVVKSKKNIEVTFQEFGQHHSLESRIILGDAVPFGTEEHQLRMMYRDAMTYLPDDILCKVDRAAMATSLETRVPFLDHRLAELAWRLPLNMKIRNGQGKWALRQVLYKYVPKELIDRPKAGFGIPLGQWLRGPLREWAEELLSLERFQNEGYFYPDPIRLKWHEHLSGNFDHSSSLWTILMFQSWLDVYKPARD